MPLYTLAYLFSHVFHIFLHSCFIHFKIYVKQDMVEKLDNK